MAWRERESPPTTHMIMSMRRQDMASWLAVAELVDNCFDAKATEVRIVFDDAAKTICIADNGVGAPDPAAICTMGEHNSEGRGTSGRYGIGAKDAVLALGTAVHVKSVRLGVCRVVKCDFDVQVATGKWSLFEDDYECADRNGTAVTVCNVLRMIKHTLLAKKLGSIFAPAIRSGSKIWCGDILCEAPDLVDVTEYRCGEGEIRGKRYSWWAGIRKDGQDVDGGWRFEFKHRCLDETSCNRAYGTEGLDIHKFYGVITLIEPDDADDDELWTVNKHKTSADELQDLCEHIFPEVKDLLEQCEAEHSLSIGADVARDVGVGLTEALRNQRKREKRQSSEDCGSGTVKPANSGKKRRRAARVSDQDGSVEEYINPVTGKRYDIKFIDDDRYGHVTGDKKANVVYLGRLHPYWQQHLGDRDVVQSAAMHMLAGHAITTEDEQQPILSVIVQDSSANSKLFKTVSNIAEMVASSTAVEAAN